MKKIFCIVIAAVALVCLTSSCTENQRVREFGGTMTVKLEPGQKLMMATWKENSLFYLTEPMEESYQPKTKTFQENSSYGMLETKVIFIESK
jgi:hypothetical protein